MLDVLFIAYDIGSISWDIYQLQQAGACEKQDLYRQLGIDFGALLLDVAFLALPGVTGGGPGLRLALAGGGHLTVAGAARAGRMVQWGFKGIQAGGQVLQFAKRGSSSGNQKHKHHPWPKYLGGPETQELYNLSDELHTEYHRRLDEYLPRRFGAKNYEKLFNTPEKMEQLLDALLEFNRRFDEVYGTHTFETLQDVLRNERLLLRP